MYRSLPETQHVQASTLSSDSVLCGIFWSDVDALGNVCSSLGWAGLWACADCWLNESWAGHAWSTGALHILCAQCECAEWIKEWVSAQFGGTSCEEWEVWWQDAAHVSNKSGLPVFFSCHWYLWGFFPLAQSSWERKTCWWPLGWPPLGAQLFSSVLSYRL